MRITKQELAHVAELARLNLNEESVELFTKQLGDILAYMEKLNHLDTEGISPTSHAISITNAFREDRVKPSVSADVAVSNAPESENGAFTVPKVIG
ncbi:MAG: Asp-tRNA(Asn)/Glu-tRNA(Gln) amidotransferase subunit GatC [Desulfobacteria bacterium]|jgi:aspartyl-tRNA(Asn)/glutamyl-tRNA(Gln) amidotransferase subunit C|nr:Asp-tRNA(Asn)/Glu-tRNA(Gln) amidotransferase subunit GatC [Deltaproteobacteria bacterium]OEU54028.1 MAG: asparaginyl/glutamyl-tRNA amidotransferase subunit C [Desulfobacterales bacterium C00003106]OEU59412.1 MAG: asparaginyl/glutamyl-tRNA amidotransferase subunit C [Desulfobacterales bacterium C00003104]